MVAGDTLTIDYKPSGANGTATLTARLGQEVLACETLNLTKPKQCADFTTRLCDGRPGIDPKAVGDELLRIAAELVARPEPAAVDPEAMPELDVSSIVRPERFITPEVSGLAVPSMTTMGDKVQGRSVLYLRWADGKRERRTDGPSPGPARRPAVVDSP